MSVTERYAFLPLAGERVLVGWHLPDRACSARAVVIASPIHEEKKAAHRPLVDLARGLARRGRACVRWDYRFTGDSTGDPSELTLGSMLEDLECLIEHAAGVTGCPEVDLVGLRLGADAAAVAASRHAVGRMALAAPLIRGDKYVREARVRGRIRAGVTAAEGGAGATDASRVEIDHGGWPISATMVSQLERHDLMECRGPLKADVLCLDIRATDRPGAHMVALAGSLRARGARAEARSLVEEPFWNALGPVVPSAFITVVADYLTPADR
jgi:pimeloyl-ACP methyl ester carboxylesterase